MSAIVGSFLATGPHIALFEDAFAEYVGVQGAVSCVNGTAALHLTLVALGVKPGDEVLVPDLTFVATANAVRMCGATPIFVDVTKTNWTMDPEAAASLVTSRTVGLIAVHLYGHLADMVALRKLAQRYGLFLVEDAAEAQGAEFQTRMAGSIGHAGTFSFYGNKLMTTGEGGMITTNDRQLEERLRHLRGQAQVVRIHRYMHDELGYNYRLANVLCAIGLAQMEGVPEALAHRQKLAEWYQTHLPLQWQIASPFTKPSWWMVTGLFQSEIDRNEVEQMLTVAGIETRQPFIPMTELPMYPRSTSNPNASRISRLGLTFPTHSAVTEDDVVSIGEFVKSVVTV
jgi:perosamine synthetase